MKSAKCNKSVSYIFPITFWLGLTFKIASTTCPIQRYYNLSFSCPPTRCCTDICLSPEVIKAFLEKPSCAVQCMVTILYNKTSNPSMNETCADGLHHSPLEGMAALELVRIHDCLWTKLNVVLTSSRSIIVWPWEAQGRVSAILEYRLLLRSDRSSCDRNQASSKQR